MRTSEIERNTNETKISLSLNIDGEGKNNISTGIGFFDHMLTHISKHGFMDMEVKAEGDTYVDCHHTIEDIGIAFGKALTKALGSKEGIKRYGSSVIPMDDVLVLCAVDISGRPYFNFDAEFTSAKLGDMDTEMIREFFRAVCTNCPMNLHIKVFSGSNNHHIAEGIFKAFGRAIDEATLIDSRIKGVLSTKGMLEV